MPVLIAAYGLLIDFWLRKASRYVRTHSDPQGFAIRSKGSQRLGGITGMGCKDVSSQTNEKLCPVPIHRRCYWFKPYRNQVL